ncbi:hypothetical protein PC116_g27133 [Phytophthora cactorum]|nr:hypothetical protein PC116_g27133 [Phytophthora cactorum]
MNIVNSYIFHKAYHNSKLSKTPIHVKFLKKLHLQLIQLQESDMYDGNPFEETVEASASGASAAAVAQDSTVHVARPRDPAQAPSTSVKILLTDERRKNTHDGILLLVL